MDAKKMVIVMSASSVIMIASCFFAHPGLLGIGLLQWIAVVGYYFFKTPMARAFGQMVAHNHVVVDESVRSRKYFKASVYVMSVPLAVGGVAIVIASIGLLLITGF